MAAGPGRRCGSRTATSPGPTSTGAPSELAAGLARLGVGHGDRVGILLNNRPEFVETAMACMKLGAIGVPVNVRFTPPELAYVISNADCRWS